MSQLQQAKREAKRLYNLLQEEQINSSTIKNLSSCKEVIAKINGYYSWHAYEENLKRRDVIDGGILLKSSSYNSQYVQMNEDIDTDYFNQELDFICHVKKPEVKKHLFLNNTPHKAVEMGISKDRGFMKNPQKYCIQSYPLTLMGATGSGKTESLLTMGGQYIENKEGLIYVDCKGDSSIFAKIYSYCQQYNRSEDLFVINFLAGNYYPIETNDSKRSHSIDPLNPLIGNDKIFQALFGTEIGEIIHAICEECKLNNLLVDSDNLKAMTMLPNLIKWSKDNTFSQAKEKINKYLFQTLNFKEDNKNSALEQHLQLCAKATDVLLIVKQYEDVGLFSKEPDIILWDIIAQSKILTVLFPALEKSVYEIFICSEIVLANIYHTTKLVEQEIKEKPHVQNIIIDEANYAIPQKLADIMFPSLTPKSNWLFGFQSFESNINSQVVNAALKYSNCVIFMKIEEHINNMPDFMVGRIFKQVNKLDNSFLFNSLQFSEQQEGHAYVFNTGCKYNILPHTSLSFRKEAFFESMTLHYISPRKPSYISLNRPDKEKLIEKNIILKELTKDKTI